MPNRAPSCSAASTKLLPSSSMTNVNTSPCFWQPKQWKKPLSGMHVERRRLLAVERAQALPVAARLPSCTCWPMTATMSARLRISLMISSAIMAVARAPQPRSPRTMTDPSSLARLECTCVVDSARDCGGRSRRLRTRRVDERVHDEHERQRDPEPEERLDAARRARGELRPVILVAEVMPVLLALRPRDLVLVDVGHDGRTLQQTPDKINARRRG